MRILVANWARRVGGGAERYLQALLPALAARGHAVGLLVEHDEADPRLRIDDPAGGVALISAESLGPERGSAAVRAWRPDLVFVQGLENPALERNLVSDCPAALFTHGYYGTCVSGTKRFALPAPRACARALGPACLGLYYPRRCGGLDPRTMVREYRRQTARRSLLARYRAVVAGSDHMAREYAAHGVAASRLFTVPMPPTGMTPDSEAPGVRPATGRVLFLGRLTSLKGAHYLLEAAPLAERALGRHLALDVAGDGPDERMLRSRARRLGVDATFHGWVEPEARARLMRGADVLAMPSLWPEPFGLVGVEAACLGLPTVGYAMGAIPEWLVAGETGEVAPATPPTAEGLAAALVRALASADHLQHLRLGAWEGSRRRTMHHHVEALEDIFRTAATG